jgi:hypothetical protein
VKHCARAKCDQRERPQPLDQQPSHDEPARPEARTV